MAKLKQHSVLHGDSISYFTSSKLIKLKLHPQRRFVKNQNSKVLKKDSKIEN